MKRCLILGLILVLSCSVANAGMTVGFTRTAYNGTLDQIDFQITGLTGTEVGELINGIGGTFSAMEPTAKLNLSTSAIGWKGSTKLNSSFEAPAAPLSFVNFDKDAGDIARVDGAGALWQSFSGSWYGQEPAVYLSPVDPDLGDGFDQTLLARIFVTTGGNVEFVGQGSPAGSGNAFTLTFNTVPEPGTIALLASGAIGLLVFAWRKRK